MSINLKCAACGHQVPFKQGGTDTEAICPNCEVLLRRQSADSQMAIPVSMALPEEFEPADLGRISKHSKEAVTRYQKNTTVKTVVRAGNASEDGHFALARAIERLASAIESPGGEISEIDAAPLNHTVASVVTVVDPIISEDSSSSSETSEQATPVPVLNEHRTGKTTATDAKGKALPIDQPVLVRNEAAAEAQQYQRKGQGATDIKGHQRSGFAMWAEAHPLAVFSTGLLLLAGLVVMTSLLLDDSESTTTEEESANLILSPETNAEDPDFFHAEREARGFLNAVALTPAKPYIFRANAIGPKLDKFYRPIPDPINYELLLIRRERNNDRSVYYYQVRSENFSQPLVVLQEKQFFRVLWEFGAGVGDISWEAFFIQKPETPVLLRAFLQPAHLFDPLHPQEEWSSWRAENWDGKHSALVFARQGSPADRRLKSAWEEHPVNRKESNWVMAQVRLKYIGSGLKNLTDTIASAEVVEVPLGSWLPEEFVVGNTFYSHKDTSKVFGADSSK